MHLGPQRARFQAKARKDSPSARKAKRKRPIKDKELAPTPKQIRILTALAAELGYPSWQAYIRERAHQYGLAEVYNRGNVSAAIDAAQKSLNKQDSLSTKARQYIST